MRFVAFAVGEGGDVVEGYAILVLPPSPSTNIHTITLTMTPFSPTCAIPSVHLCNTIIPSLGLLAVTCTWWQRWSSTLLFCFSTLRWKLSRSSAPTKFLSRYTAPTRILYCSTAPAQPRPYHSLFYFLTRSPRSFRSSFDGFTCRRRGNQKERRILVRP